jgi:hypothetical protein
MASFDEDSLSRLTSFNISIESGELYGYLLVVVPLLLIVTRMFSSVPEISIISDIWC